MCRVQVLVGLFAVTPVSLGLACRHRYEHIDSQDDDAWIPSADSGGVDGGGADGGPESSIDGGPTDAGGDMDAGPRDCTPPSGACIWTGAVSTAWSEPGNWSACGGGAPGAGSWVFVDASAPRQPVVSEAITIRGFSGTPSCQGTVTLGARVTLRDSGATFAGSVRFVAASVPCASCVVNLESGGTIRDGARVTLGPGTTLLIRDHSELQIGGTTTSGHFATEGGSGPVEQWPVFSSPAGSDPGHYGLRIQGAAADRSSLSINGLVFENAHERDGANSYMIEIGANVDLLRLDHVAFRPYLPGPDLSIRVFDCAGLVIEDTTWDDLRFEYVVADSLEDVNVEVMCDLGVRVAVSGSGSGFGPSFELDTMDQIDW